MSPRSLSLVPVIAVLLAFGLCPAASAAGAPRVLLDQDFPDPDIVKTDPGYPALCMSTRSVNIPVAGAPAAEGPWRVTGDALAAVPSWAKPDGGFWAPDVTR